jgi:hypothetical protein
MNSLKNKLSWPKTIFLGGSVVVAGALCSIAIAAVVAMQIDQAIKDVEY